jgi:tetratricopeptide (TPR) repeat protein
LDQPALLRRWAEACDLAGDFTDAVRLGDEAIRALGPDPDPTRLADLLDRQAAHLWELGDNAGAMRSVVEALARLPGEDSAIRSSLLASKARFQMLREDNLAAIRTAEAAIAMARASGARQTEGHALTSLGTAMCETGAFDEGIAHIREALEIGLELGAVYDIMRALVNLTNMLAAAGRSDEADTVAAEGLERSRDLGVERNTGVIFLHNMAMPAAFKGDWAVVDALQSQIESYAPSGFNFLELLGIGIMSASDRGDQVRAAELLGEGRRRAADWGTDRADDLFLRHEILLALRSGDLTRAASLGRPPVGDPDHPHVAWLIGQVQSARLAAAHSMGDHATIRDIADGAADLLREVEEGIAVRAAAGWPWRWERLPPLLAAKAELTGILSRPEPALWTKALVEARRSGFRPLEADLLLGRATALATLGSPRAEVEADLEASLTIAQDLGYQPTVDRVRAQLEQLRTQGSKP